MLLNKYDRNGAPNKVARLIGYCFLACNLSILHLQIDPKCNLCEHREETLWECPHPMVHDNQLPHTPGTLMNS
jgi:hypothetical protein